MTLRPDLNQLPLPELYHHLASTGLVDRLAKLARDEDLSTARHSGDITSRAWDDDPAPARAHIVARSACTVAGLAALPTFAAAIDPAVTVRPRAADGHTASPGDVLAEVTGPLPAVLAAERTLLNLLARLSGVATLTARYVDAAGPDARDRVFDTRKTTPGLRVLEKYAVRCGGGMSHRIGLYDAVLLKDNHLAAHPGPLAERVRRAAARAREDRPLRFVQVEVETLAQLDELLDLEPGVVDIALLDNMNTDRLARAVENRDAVNPALLLEASGGVNLDTIRAIADTGVDRISVGAITHQAVSADLSMDLTDPG